jgi:putative effector of murein hydrolase
MHTNAQSVLQLILNFPLFPLALTLFSYVVAITLKRKMQWGIVPPVLIGVIVVVAVLSCLRIDVDAYFTGNAMLTLLLGTSIVSLAIPLYTNLSKIRQYLVPVLITTVVGGLFSTILVIAFAWLLHIDLKVLLSLTTKSVTAAVAASLADEIGAIMPLSVIFVIFTGMVGVLFAPLMMRKAGVNHPVAVGMSMGITAHAIGTAWLLEHDREAGGVATLAMTLMAIFTVILLPLGIKLMIG